MTYVWHLQKSFLEQTTSYGLTLTTTCKAENEHSMNMAKEAQQKHSIAESKIFVVSTHNYVPTWIGVSSTQAHSQNVESLEGP